MSTPTTARAQPIDADLTGRLAFAPRKRRVSVRQQQRRGEEAQRGEASRPDDQGEGEGAGQSHGIPIANIDRTASEVQLYFDEQVAEERDNTFFARLVNGIGGRNEDIFRDSTNKYLEMENQLSLAHIIQTHYEGRPVVDWMEHLGQQQQSPRRSSHPSYAGAAMGPHAVIDDRFVQSVTSDAMATAMTRSESGIFDMEI